MRHSNWLLRVSGTCIALALAGGAATAQEQAIDEVIVTAQKRAISLQEVPIAVTALTADDIEAHNFSDATSLAEQVPNLQIDSPWGYSNPGIFLRGVGNGDVNAVAASKVGVYVDQVYNGLLVGQNFQLFDLERIEVLKGPQGTLYGKNTTGGALNIISRKPDGEFGGYAQLNAGNFEYLSAEAALGFPLAEGLSGRIAGVINKRDGTATNLVDGSDLNDVDNYAVRGMLRWQSERVDALLRAQLGRNRTGFRQGKPNTAPGPGGATITGFVNPPGDEFDLTTDLDTFMDVDQNGVALIVDIELGSGLTLTSVSSYDEGELRALQDADHSSDSLIDIGWRTDSNQLAQELRLTSDPEKRFDYILGLFYVDEEIEDGTGSDFRIFADAPHPPFPTLEIKQDMAQSAQQYAAFADFTYELAPRWTLNGGLRYTIDEKEFYTVAELVGVDGTPLPPGAAFTVPRTEFDERWTATSGHVGLEFRPSDDVMIYGSFSRGFNGGGFNGGAIVDPGEAVAFDPEYLEGWEIGAKTQWLERRVTLNAAAFFYDYSDLQVQTIATSPFSNNFIQIVENASDAEIYGAEIELAARATEHLRLSAALGLLHTEFVDFQSILADQSGNPLPEAPEVDFVGSFHYERPFQLGSWFLRGEVNYTSERYYNSGKNPLVSSQGGYTIVNARLGWISQDGRWSASLWANNLTDEVYLARALDLVGGFGFVSNWFSDPRTYGVQVAVRFD